METLKFKTNIKCGGCIATVKPFLEENKDIQSWTVDTGSLDKVLTIEGQVSPEQVIGILEKAGFQAREI